MATLYVGNDMRLALESSGKLKDENGDAVPGATVEATLYEYGSDTSVGGVSWPITLEEGENDGEYFGIIPAGAEIESGRSYDLELNVESPGGTKGLWVTMVEAKHRRM